MKRYEKQELLTAVSAIAMGLFIALFVLTALLLMGGCTRRVYVPVKNTVTRTDTVYSAKVRVDSVIFRDSVAVMQKGDTVFMTKYRDRYKVRQRTDTVYQAVTDSVKVKVPYPVERKLTAWEQTKMDFGGMFLGGMVVAVIAAVIIWIVKRKRRK